MNEPDARLQSAFIARRLFSEKLERELLRVADRHCRPISARERLKLQDAGTVSAAIVVVVLLEATDGASGLLAHAVIDSATTRLSASVRVDHTNFIKLNLTFRK